MALQERRSAAIDSAGNTGVVVLQENGRSFGRTRRDGAGWSAGQKKEFGKEELKEKVWDGSQVPDLFFLQVCNR